MFHPTLTAPPSLSTHPPTLPQNSVLPSPITTSLTYPLGAYPPPGRGPLWSMWIWNVPLCSTSTQFTPLSPQDPSHVGPLLPVGSPIPHPAADLGFYPWFDLPPSVVTPPGSMKCWGSPPNSPAWITVSPEQLRCKISPTSLYWLPPSQVSMICGPTPYVPYVYWRWSPASCRPLPSVSGTGSRTRTPFPGAVCIT